MTPWGFCPTESQCLTGGPDSHGHTLGRLSRRVRPATGPGPPESALLVWGGCWGASGLLAVGPHPRRMKSGSRRPRRWYCMKLPGSSLWQGKSRTWEQPGVGPRSQRCHLPALAMWISDATFLSLTSLPSAEWG